MILLITYSTSPVSAGVLAVNEVLRYADDYCYVFDGAQLIKTVDPPKMWYEKIESAAPGFQCLIVDIEEKEKYGCLPKEVWTWINKHEK